MAKLEVGDVVDWAPGNPGTDFDDVFSPGPFIVVRSYKSKIQTNLVELFYLYANTPLKPLLFRENLDPGQLAFGFYASRFRKNEFLTAARKAVVDAKA